MNESIRADFPFLQKDPTPIYFDNACMTLKPRQVIDALIEYYTDYPVCGGRSVHEAGMEVTVKVQESRDAFASAFGREPHEVIFTKNTTEAINLVAKGFPFEKGDRVLTTGYEHNSNIIPWLQMARLKGIEVVPVPPAEDLTFDMEAFEAELSKGAAMVSVTHTSNLNGYTIPLKEVVERSHDRGTPVLVDGAQSAPHKRVDLGALDVDLYALSVHKMLGPTGIGVLLGKEDVLNKLEALCPGGGTVTCGPSRPARGRSSGLCRYHRVQGCRRLPHEDRPGDHRGARDGPQHQSDRGSDGDRGRLDSPAGRSRAPFRYYLVQRRGHEPT